MKRIKQPGPYPGEGYQTLGTKGRKLYDATGEFRPPKRGEFYLSGADVIAYRAPNDFTTAYWIAKEHQPLTRPEIAQRLEMLAKMTRDGDETTNEIAEAVQAINDLKKRENFD